MKDSTKIKTLLKSGPLFLFCAFMAVSCRHNANSTKTETDTMEVKKDSLPPLDTGDSNSTRPETIKNGGVPTTHYN